MKPIFLIGYMGTGKSTLGRELAQSLNLSFVDLDNFIENRYNKTISQLFEEGGESFFRDVERKTLQEVALFEDVIISTGGGTPCFFDNMQIMNDLGTTIHLATDISVLCSRLNKFKDKRPLIKDKTEEELYSFIQENLEKRNPYYNKAQMAFETKEITNKEDLQAHVDELISRIIY